MICPNEICNKEIPDDSLFCDQCGCQLRECPDCHAVLYKPFCSKCGTRTEERKWIDSIPVVDNSNVNKSSISDADEMEDTSQTLIITKTPALKLQHDDLILNIKSGDVLGRTTGAHDGALADFKVISSRHAEVRLSDNKWIITDLGSTNGSFLNNQKLDANSDYEIHDGDIVKLANISFTAHIN